MPTKKTSKKKQQDTLTQRISIMSLDHIRCRDIGHVWRESTPSTLANRPGWRRALKCDKKHGGCGAERIEYIHTDGSINGRTYRYPDGYQLKGLGIKGGLPKSDFRKEYFARMVKDS